MRFTTEYTPSSLGLSVCFGNVDEPKTGRRADVRCWRFITGTRRCANELNEGNTSKMDREQTIGECNMLSSVSVLVVVVDSVLYCCNNFCCCCCSDGGGGE